MNLLKSGYAKVSNTHRIVSRIDREDWREHMAQEHTPWNPKVGIEWIESMGPRLAADQYRRCYSKDTRVVSSQEFKKLPSSGYGAIEFLDLVE